MEYSESFGLGISLPYLFIGIKCQALCKVRLATCLTRWAIAFLERSCTFCKWGGVWWLVVCCFLATTLGTVVRAMSSLISPIECDVEISKYASSSSYIHYHQLQNAGSRGDFFSPVTSSAPNRNGATDTSETRPFRIILSSALWLGRVIPPTEWPSRYT